MKKRFLIVLTAAVLLLAGCGKSDEENADSVAETDVSGNVIEPETDDEKEDNDSGNDNKDKDSGDDKKSKDDKESKDDKKDSKSKDDKDSKDAKDKSDKDSGEEEDDESSAEEVTEEPAPEYSFDVQNEYFGAYVKSLEEADGGATLTIEFVNVSDQVYYKSDEEMKPGATWEKSITQPKEKWLAAAEKGTENWIHYEFYDKESKCIFKGGVVFKTNKNIEATDMRVFTE